MTPFYSLNICYHGIETPDTVLLHRRASEEEVVLPLALLRMKELIEKGVIQANGIFSVYEKNSLERSEFVQEYRYSSTTKTVGLFTKPEGF